MGSSNIKFPFITCYFNFLETKERTLVESNLIISDLIKIKSSYISFLNVVFIKAYDILVEKVNII